MKNNYTIYHLHDDHSVLDSATKFKSYLEKALECDMEALGVSNHGNIYDWIKKKQMCDKVGIKYIHGQEFYVTESLEKKVRDNWHCILIARNYEGVKELNKLSSLAYQKDGHFYYDPRITIEELLNTSNNIIITTACLGGILNHAPDNIKDKFLEFMVANKERCFLEIQHHYDEAQVKYNKCLFELHKQYGIPLIAGVDTHSLNQELAEARKILQLSKNIKYADEEGWDLTFKTYDVLVEAYGIQNSLPKAVYMEAIETTNLLADMIEKFDLDYSYKYPKIYDNAEEIFVKKVNKALIEKGLDNDIYRNRIAHEIEGIKNNNAIDYLLLQEKIISWCRENSIYPGPSRGSVSGCLCAYLLGITEVDPIKYGLSFERFMNPERVSLSDIDIDYPPNKRDVVKEYVFNELGLHCCDIVAYNTLAKKGAIRDVARALEIPLKEVNEICKNIEISEDEYRQQYPELFKYVDLLYGVITSVSIHPSGSVVSDRNLEEELGLSTSGTHNLPISQADMNAIDSINYVKLDILGLDNIQLINETCKLAEIERINPDNLDFNDFSVWKDIAENNVSIFQMESDYAGHIIRQLFSDETLRKIKKEIGYLDYLSLFSMANGALRPAGESYRDKMAQGIVNDNGHSALNEMLAPTLGYLVYQEQIIEFLNKFCGYSMGKADIIRRCVDENTEIMMGNGDYKKIKDIQVGDYVQSLNKYDVFEPKRVLGVYNNGLQKTYRIKANNGYELIATGDHKILTQSGWKKIKDVSLNDFIMTPKNILSIDDGLNPNLYCPKTYELLHADYIPFQIKEIEEVGERNVYDITVEDNHNYVANGIVVHNCFAKKTGEMYLHIPEIKAGFVATMTEKYGTDPKEAKKIVESFLRVIEDASNYLFSVNHSKPYSMIAFACGYLRKYYPLEYLTVLLNINESNQEKTMKIIEYARSRGIEIKPVEFGKSKANYFFDRNENIIYRGCASLKYLNNDVSNKLYELSKNNYESFVSLLIDIEENTVADTRQLSTLIKLNYFKGFGNNGKLLKLFEEFTKGKNRYNKNHKEATKTKRIEALKQLEKELPNDRIPLVEQIKFENEILGYVQVTFDVEKRYVYIMDIDTKYAPRVECYCLANGKTESFKIYRKTFESNPLKKGDIIYIRHWEVKPKKQYENGRFKDIEGTKEWWITAYEIKNKEFY